MTELEAAPPTLTDAHRAAFRARGYLAFRDLLSADEVAAALAALDALAARAATDPTVQAQREPTASKYAPLRKLMGYLGHAPRLAAVAAHPGITALVEDLLGPGARCFQDMALLKPAHAGSEKPWHQDAAYFDVLPVDAVAGAWLALDPATEQNGCMQVWPGAHTGGPRAHHHLPVQVPDGHGCLRPSTHTDCQMAPPPPGAAVHVPLPPGGVLLFSPLLPHATAANTSDAPRRALQLHYRAAGSERVSRVEYARVFVTAAGEPAACVRA